MEQKPLASISCLSCTLSGLSHNTYVFEVSIKWFFITLRALKCNIDFGKMTSEITWFKQESYSLGIAITYQNELECSRIRKIYDSICPSKWYQMPNFGVWAHGLIVVASKAKHHQNGIFTWRGMRAIFSISCVWMIARTCVGPYSVCTWSWTMAVVYTADTLIDICEH